MSDPGITVRIATADDVGTLAAIGSASFEGAYGGTATADDLLAHLDEFFGAAAVAKEIRAAGTVYLIASAAGQPAGFAKIRDSETPAAVPARAVLELQQVYVSPDAQRGGVGGHLIRAASDYAKQLSAEGLWLSVWEEADWAINAYKKHGFVVVGEAEFRLGTTHYSDLLMWLPV